MALNLKAEYHASTNKMYAPERVNAKKKRKKLNLEICCLTKGCNYKAADSYLSPLVLVSQLSVI